MPNILGGRPGRVVAVDCGDDGFLPLGLVVGDFKNDLGVKGLLTGLSVNGQSGFQLMHTLRQYIYIYTFGERAGEIAITGLAFVGDCRDMSDPSGLARLFDWYERNRVSTTGKSITVTLTPSVALKAFLVNFRYDIEDPTISLGRFSMQLVYPPRIRKSGPSSFPLPSQTGITTSSVLHTNPNSPITLPTGVVINTP
jgi:hypothetical protein